MRQVFSGVVLCALLFAAALGQAQQQPAGRITAVLGQLEAIAADGSVRRLERGDPVFQGDTLRSGASGRAQIRFTDRGVLSLRSNTELGIDDYGFDAANPAGGRQQLILDRGGFRTQTGGIAAGNRAAYRVQTPVAVIGIRGTIFEAHQEAGGALFVGADQGGVDVTSSTGATARIGEGESFSYLRVNPDGSIDYLLEPPDQFSESPGIDDAENGDADDSGAGEPQTASISTGSGAAETTAGTDPAAGSEFVAVTDDPESTGTIAPSEQGSGVPPTTTFLRRLDDPVTDPVVTDPGVTDPVIDDDIVDLAAVLSPAQEAALLADNRLGLASGGPTGLEGGIATFNSPLLALSSGQGGFAAGIGGTDRGVALDAADVFLLPESGMFTLEEDVDGIPGLVWGRFSAPVTLFLDPLDATRVLELDRDVLFVLGTPESLASMQGVRFYELTRFEALSSGLEITDLFANLTVDLNTGLFFGLLDVFFEADDLVLISDFRGSVIGGVLEDIEIASLELFESSTEAGVPGEGTLAGFFTGGEGAFLQLAFDYRVPSRTDANVSGLVLLQRDDDVELPTGALTPLEAVALDTGRAFVGVSCCFDVLASTAGPVYGLASTLSEDGLLLGINLNAAGVPLRPPQSVVDFPPDVIVREALVDVSFFASNFDLPGTESLAVIGFSREGERFAGLDAETGDPLLDFGNSILVLTGMPTQTANLMSNGRYEFDRSFDARVEFGSGTIAPVALNVEALSLSMNLGDGLLPEGLFRASFEYEGADGIAYTALARAVLRGSIAAVDNRAFLDMLASGSIVVSGGEGGSLALLGGQRFGGFFTGDFEEAFAGAFRLQTQQGAVQAGPQEALLLTGGAILAKRDLSLTTAEAADLDSGRLFVGAGCCGSAGINAGVVAGFASSTDPVTALFGYNVDGDDTLRVASDPGFLALGPDRIIRRVDAFSNSPVVPIAGSGSASPALIRWLQLDVSSNRPLNIDAVTGRIVRTFGDSFQALSALPSDIAGLQAAGFSTFAGAGTSGGFAPSNSLLLSGRDSFGVVSAGAASFNVDLGSGEIFAGHLSVAQRLGPEDPVTGSDVNWDVFFRGQIAYDNGNTFAELELLNGRYNGVSQTFPIDLDTSRVTGFFGGESGVLFSGAFNLRTAGGLTTAGVFGIGNTALPETRLGVGDVGAWMSPDRLGLGLATFVNVAGSPGNGLLLGRAGLADPETDFVLGANPLRVADGDLTRTTRRPDFFAQPYAFVLRQGDTFTDEMDFVPDARPALSQILSGFEIGWGAWRNGGSGADAQIQNDPAMPSGLVNIPADVFFASINPTPAALLPNGGIATYGGPVASLGGANGSFSEPISAGGSTALGALSVSFDLDFSTGAIASGLLNVQYESRFDSVVAWAAEFSGFLNGAITDLTLDSLTLFEDGSTLGSGNLDASRITGILTGPGGIRHAGAFSFLAENINSDFPIETVRGLWVVDRDL